MKRALRFDAPARTLSALLLTILAGCSSPPQGVTVLKPPAADAGLRGDLAKSPADYPLGINDELDIKFLEQPDLNETTRVRPDGNISLQIVGTVRAAGLTPDALQAEIVRRLRQLAGTNATKEYVIHANDDLEVKFRYQPELNERENVRPDGKITLPIVDTVIAEGRTPEALAADLRRLYAPYLRSPELIVILRSAAVQSYRVGGRDVRTGAENLQPTVLVRSYSVPQIFVGGEVARPGVLAYRPSLTLMQAIIEAGGVKPSAELAAVLVLRKRSDGQPLAIRRDLSADLRASGANDILLEPFDVVVLPKTTSASIAQLLEQSVYNILPPLKNSAFSFLYQLNSPEVRLVP